MTDVDLLLLPAFQRAYKENPLGFASLDETGRVPSGQLGTTPVPGHPAERFLNAERRFVTLAARETALPVDLAFLEIMG